MVKVCHCQFVRSKNKQYWLLTQNAGRLNCIMVHWGHWPVRFGWILRLCNWHYRDHMQTLWLLQWLYYILACNRYIFKNKTRSEHAASHQGKKQISPSENVFIRQHTAGVFKVWHTVDPSTKSRELRPPFLLGIMMFWKYTSHDPLGDVNSK